VRKKRQLTVRSSFMSSSRQRRVLLIGLDAADWRIIHPLLDSGRMPNLSAFVDNGCIGNLATMQPCLSPMLWTSVITGMHPSRHGVLGFIEPSLDGASVRRVGSRTRKVKAIWNIASQCNLRSVIVNWYASYPAEPVDGIVVSDQAFTRAASTSAMEWPAPIDSFHPLEFAVPLMTLRLHPDELEFCDLADFISEGARSLSIQDDKVVALKESIAKNFSVHSLFTASIENECWDFAAVYYDMLDTLGHVFMPYHPPKLEHIEEADFLCYRNVICKAYELFDQMLGRLLELVGDHTDVLIISDHGFKSGEDRPDSTNVPMELDIDAAQWHRDFGIIAMQGPSIRKDERIYGATLLDIAPTVLTLLGLPSGEDMPGNILVDAFVKKDTPNRIGSWEDESDSTSIHKTLNSVCPTMSQEEVEQLINLGYLPKEARESAKLASWAAEENSLNLAISLLFVGQPSTALPLLESLSLENPGATRVLYVLATCLNHLKKPTQCIEVISRIEKLGGLTADAHLLVAASHAQIGNHKLSVFHWTTAIEQSPRSWLSLTLYAEYCSEFANYAKAIDLFHRAAELNQDAARPWEGLARIYFKDGRYEQAIAAAKHAVSRRYHSPLAHLCIGLSYKNLGNLSFAIDALKIALHQDDSLFDARTQLEELLVSTGRLTELQIHQQRSPSLSQSSQSVTLGSVGTKRAIHEGFETAKEVPIACPQAIHEDTIVIATGLPRSGTSLLMQMFQAVGYSLGCDNERFADEDNPNGYFEYSNTRNLNLDSTWIPQMRGRALKIAFPMVLNIPEGEDYRVVFIERNLDETLQSQAKMLQRRNATQQDPLRLKQWWEQKVRSGQRILEERSDCQILVVDHRMVVERNSDTLQSIAVFLGKPNLKDALASVIDLSLYRNRNC